jgi:DNA-binding SARP family transcriptional activator
LLHLIITIILGITATFLGLVAFYALRRINEYENIILNINNTIETIKIQLKTIDDKGTFESDDEVGFFFSEIKQLGQDLENLFETEVEDAPIKEKKKKEK